MIKLSMLRYYSRMEMMYSLPKYSSDPLGPMDLSLVSIMITLL